MQIGFIGVGNMGSAMTRRLLQAGHQVRVWDVSQESMQALAAEGAQMAASAADAFAGDAVITMVTNDDAVRALYLDSDILSQAQSKMVHVNMASISVAMARRLAAAHLACGIDYVSAPVFGRPEVAAKGQIGIVAAGPAHAIAQVQPLFDAMGKKTWVTGEEASQANVVKIGYNLMIGAAIEAMAEATALGNAHGVSAADMIDIYTSTGFASLVYQGYGGSIAARKYEPAGFTLALGLKDIRLALQAGDAANVPLPLASVVRDALIEATAAGDSDKDWAVAAETALKRSGRIRSDPIQRQASSEQAER